ncbi:hypothetical protein KM043_002149 [Ampulex compressa]|nr:hypothetical protein KM043_002149 [Ampulex compressa]
MTVGGPPVQVGSTPVRSIHSEKLDRRESTRAHYDESRDAASLVGGPVFSCENEFFSREEIDPPGDARSGDEAGFRVTCPVGYFWPRVTFFKMLGCAPRNVHLVFVKCSPVISYFRLIWIVGV